ncbi:MAG: hypothetical protein WBO25_08740 [Acidimicrobiia bacterium]|jgi:drug/metabolite transporter (DMT)-like permease
MTQRTRAYLGLFVAAFLFGVTFVVIKDAATAALVLGERLTVRGWLGAALIMAGVYVVLTFAPPEEADFIVTATATGVH